MMSAVVNSEINAEYHGSDHCPLSLTIDINKISQLNGQAPIRVLINNIIEVEKEDDDKDESIEFVAAVIKKKEEKIVAP